VTRAPNGPWRSISTRRSKLSRSIAAGVGPAVNLVLGIACVWLASAHDVDFRRAFQFVMFDGQPVLFGGGSTPEHARFWCAVAFLGLLQMTAAVLNLLPVPGLDGWGIIEPYIHPDTARAAEKIKPWGMLGVIVLLTVQGVNARFFQLVYWIYGLFDSSDVSAAMADVGHEFFRWWVSSPL